MTIAMALVVAAAFVVQLTRVVTSARSGRQRTLIVTGNLLYALALLAFLYPPASSTRHDELVVLTPHATADERRQASRARNVVAVGKAGLPDISAVRAARPEARVWRVLGAGLAPATRADNINIEYTSTGSPAGFVDASWPQQLAPGETFEVRGSVHANDPSAHVVALLDPSGDVAAATPLDDQGQFFLRAPTRAAGVAMFSLTLRAADDALVESVPLPVDLRPPSPLRVWVRSASPSFEVRYLKDWARRGNARMVVDTMLSRDKPRREYVNHEGATVGDLDRASLANYDLLVLDARALDRLSASQLNDVVSALAQDLTGVIIIGASDPTRMAQFGGPAATLTPTSSLAVALPGASGTQVNVSARFDTTSGDVLLRSLSGVPLAKRSGGGDHALVVTLINDSFRWVTAGQNATHTIYWNTLIDGALTAQPEPVVTTLPADAYAHERQLLCIRDGSADAVEVQADGAQAVALQLGPVPERPGELCALNYPRDGWHTIRMQGEDIARRYVFAAGDWSTRQRWLRSQHTGRLAARAPVAVPATTTRARWPRWPFAVITLLLAAVLWFEQRRFVLQSN